MRAADGRTRGEEGRKEGGRGGILSIYCAPPAEREEQTRIRMRVG